MAKGGQSDQMKSLKKSNDSLKKQLENARKDIKRLEERVDVQEHASKEHNGGPSREVQLETERSLSWLHESEIRAHRDPLLTFVHEYKVSSRAPVLCPNFSVCA